MKRSREAKLKEAKGVKRYTEAKLKEAKGKGRWLTL